MKPAILFIAMLFISCSEPPSEPWDPGKDPDPLAEFHYVADAPDWPAATLSGEFQGPEYRITPDSIIYVSHPVRQAWPVEYRSDGKDVWMTTPKGEHRFRAPLGAKLTGKIIHKSNNGRYGPVYPITFERVQ